VIFKIFPHEPILGIDILQPTQTTADSVRESLSALMDDAAQPLELQRVLKASHDDSQVREQWARYQLASAALKRQATSTSSPLSLADSVRTALESEATIQMSKSSAVAHKLSQFWQPVAGLAVAASVTVVMVMGAQRMGVASQPSIIPAQQGVVLLEPRNSNRGIELASTNAANTTASVTNTNQIIRLPAPTQAVNASDGQWLAQYAPAGFVLTQRSLDEANNPPREVLTYSDGDASFTLYVEELNGRDIAEGHAYAGSNLVLGQSLSNNGDSVFVTLVGQLSLAQAEQVANSVVSLKAQ